MVTMRVERVQARAVKAQRGSPTAKRKIVATKSDTSMIPSIQRPM